MSKFDAMASIMADIARRHRSQGGDEASDALYYELTARYYARIREALKEGLPVVAHGAMIPPEVLYAMDIVPMQMEATSTGTVATLKIQDEVISMAGKVGWGASVCSSHQIQAVMLAKGWLPRPDAIVWGYHVCDPNAKSGEVVQRYYGVPGFFLDRPYQAREADRRYYAGELGDLVQFLERLTGRSMDWGRFRQALDSAREMATIHQETSRLRGAIPCPMPNRQGMQLAGVAPLYSGTQVAVDYLQVVRGELRARVEKGIGYAREEKHRLIGLFPPPTYAMKLLDWMQREHGAVIVSEPWNGRWGDWEVDPGDPLGSLAARCFAMPNSRQLHGPAYQAAIPDAVEDALKYKADGAIYWANLTCPHCLGLTRLMSDALLEKAGIPTLVIPMDMMDPTGFSHEDLKTIIEVFLEKLAKRRQ